MTSNPVALVRTEVKSFEDRTPVRKSLLFWCPGCDKAHRIVFEQVADETGPVWDWDGNLEAPTVSPSILTTQEWGPQREKRVCHSFLRGGQWQFLGDCTHELAGQTVPMVPLPDWLVAE